MHGIRGASRHCPALVMEFDLAMLRDPNTENFGMVTSDMVWLKGYYIVLPASSKSKMWSR